MRGALGRVPRILFWLLATMTALAGCGDGIKCEHGPVTKCSSGRRISVLFNRDAAPTLAEVKRLVDLVRETDSLHGFPRRYLGTSPVTVSIVARQSSGVDGTAFSEERIISLPLAAVSEWRTEDLRTLLRHELTHVALAGLRKRTQFPKWFEEGFAEWAAGGLSCEGAARIRVNLLLKNALLSDTSLFNDQHVVAARVGYDLYGTFFEFLERRAPGTNSLMLDSVNAYGLESGIERLMGADLATLKQQWLSELQKQYGDLGGQGTCSSERF